MAARRLRRRPALTVLFAAFVMTALLVTVAWRVGRLLPHPPLVPPRKSAIPFQNEPLSLLPHAAEEGSRPLVIAWERRSARPTFVLYDGRAWIREMERRYYTAGTLDSCEHFQLVAAFRGLDLLSVSPRRWLVPVALDSGNYFVCVAHGERWHCGGVSGMAPRGSPTAHGPAAVGLADRVPIPTPMARARELIRGIDGSQAVRFEPTRYAFSYAPARVRSYLPESLQREDFRVQVPWPSSLPALDGVQVHRSRAYRQYLTPDEAARVRAYLDAHPEATSFDDGHGIHVITRPWWVLPGAEMIQALDDAISDLSLASG